MLETECKQLARILDDWLVPGENPHFRMLRQQQVAYFARGLRAFSVPLHLPGTAFQAVSYGTTRSYAQQAAALHHRGRWCHKGLWRRFMA